MMKLLHGNDQVERTLQIEGVTVAVYEPNKGFEVFGEGASFRYYGKTFVNAMFSGDQQQVRRPVREKYGYQDIIPDKHEINSFRTPIDKIKDRTYPDREKIFESYNLPIRSKELNSDEGHGPFGQGTEFSAIMDPYLVNGALTLHAGSGNPRVAFSAIYTPAGNPVLKLVAVSSPFNVSVAREDLAVIAQKAAAELHLDKVQPAIVAARLGELGKAGTAQNTIDAYIGK